jgi:peptidoglycan/xylan/chitin deacetylase (PgdA/CDA1 family)
MIFFLIGIGILIVILLVLTIEYSLLVPASKGLAILMYHKVSRSDADDLTISVSMLERQLRFIKENNYSLLSFSELEAIQRGNLKLPKRPLVITFDDAYQSYYDLALPVILQYGLKATVFVPVAYMGKTNIWDQGEDPIMSPEILKKISSPETTEIGLHSFLHRSYQDLATEDMKEDLDNCCISLKFYNIPFVKVLAYPYGAFPRKDKIQNQEMKNLFREKGVIFALRIGNRINRWPVKDPYEMKRIDIRGRDNFFTFKTKLKKGRKKLFS